MAAIIAVEHEGKAFVAGLTWAALAGSTKTHGAQIRAAAHDTEASHVIVVSNREQSAVGMFAESEIDAYVDADLDEDSSRRAAKTVRKSRRKLHSLAAAFSRVAGDGFALLVYTVQATGEVVLIVSDSGIPQADEVKNPDDARAAAAGYAQGANGFAYAVYSNDLGLFPDAIALSDEQLWQAAGRHTALGSVPLSIAKLAIGALVITACAVAVLSWQEHQKSRALMELARQSALADPLPRYNTQLAIELPKLGMAPGEVVRIMELMRQHPLHSEGWQLQSVECSVPKTCASTWKRAGGLTQGLLNSRQLLGERLLESEGDSLTTVRLVRDVEMKVQGVGSRQELQSMEQSKGALTGLAQVLDNMGAALKTGAVGFSRWPSVPDLDLKSVPAASVVHSVPIEMTLDAALADQLMSSIPPGIWISRIQFHIDAGTGTPRVGAVITGASYVR
jgi:hypothetical protein